MNTTLKVVSVAALLANPTFASSDTAPASWLFAQTGDSFIVEDGVLTLFSDRDIFGFTDRPDRVHHYLTPHEFVALWATDAGANFAGNPPNAVVTWVDGEDVFESEVILQGADMNPTGRAIHYSYEYLSGDELPASATYASVFIDSVGCDVNKMQQDTLDQSKALTKQIPGVGWMADVAAAPQQLGIAVAGQVFGC